MGVLSGSDSMKPVGDFSDADKLILNGHGLILGKLIKCSLHSVLRWVTLLWPPPPQGWVFVSAQTGEILGLWLMETRVSRLGPAATSTRQPCSKITTKGHRSCYSILWYGAPKIDKCGVVIRGFGRSQAPTTLPASWNVRSWRDLSFSPLLRDSRLELRAIICHGVRVWNVIVWNNLTLWERYHYMWNCLDFTLSWILHFSQVTLCSETLWDGYVGDVYELFI